MKLLILLAGLVLLCHAEEEQKPDIFEKLLTIHETKDDNSGNVRVTFSNGREGEKRDDLIISPEQKAWLFGNDTEYLQSLRDHVDESIDALMEITDETIAAETAANATIEAALEAAVRLAAGEGTIPTIGDLLAAAVELVATKEVDGTTAGSVLAAAARLADLNLGETTFQAVSEAVSQLSVASGTSALVDAVQDATSRLAAADKTTTTAGTVLAAAARLAALKRTKRAGTEIRRGINWWPNGVIPYVINLPDFDAKEQKELREAMDVYEKLTCVEFVQKTQADKQWLYIHHTDDGCYSYLGDARAYSPGPQPLSLQRNGCRHFGTYLHELGHAIGLVHEHQLPTRDRYVRYFATNIDPDNLSQLEKYNPRVVNTFNTEYDLGSIMHYDLMSFSIDDKSPTLGADDPWLVQHIGRRYSPRLSYGDVRTVNMLYDCAKKKCSGRQLEPCPTGFIDHKCKCINPIKYYNTECTDQPGYEGFCRQMAPEGKCDIRFLDHHLTCGRTCGFCPRFSPGDSAIGPVNERRGKSCVDRYHDRTLCLQWKSKYCSTPWMQRNCRATCGACKSQVGDCPNMDPDSICDRYYKTRMCTRSDAGFREYLRVRCADSCNSCHARNRDDSCRNKAEDDQCELWAREGACERLPLKMFDQCASTCNRCYWNKGNCSNQYSDDSCQKMALANYCVKGGKKHLEVKTGCGKTCDTCPGTQRGRGIGLMTDLR